MKKPLTNHYDKKYFNYQQELGIFGGNAERFKFEDYIKREDVVLDYGCGGGYVLSNLKCKLKIGIEINPEAINEAIGNGIKVFKKPALVKTKVDVIISNHALEHVDNPLEELQNLKKLLKKNGLIVLVVPQEIKTTYKHDDINQHLFTWSEQSLGNLFTKAGYKIVKVETIKHLWPPHFKEIHRLFGDRIFHILSKLYARVKSKTFQIRVIAKV
jgi:SAM-dependent methyltransferase